MRYRPDIDLLASRTWELLLGALVAIGACPATRTQCARNTLTLAGIGLIVLGYFTIRSTTAFPAPWALLPCAGAALVLAYGDGAVTSRVLGFWPLRWLGKISYSLYLVHWPIIALYRLNTGVDLSKLETLMLFAASIALASLSFLLVERPTLKLAHDARPWTVIMIALPAIAIMTVTPIGMAATLDAHAQDPRVVRTQSFIDYPSTRDYAYQFRTGQCFRSRSERHIRFEPNACLSLAADRSNMVVLGDSHAAQYWRAISLRYTDLNVLQATATGCRPLHLGKGEPRCTEVVHFVFDHIVPTGPVDTLVLAARWQPDEFSLLTSTIDYVRPHVRRVIVIGPTLEYDGELPRIAARALRSQRELDSIARFRIDEIDSRDRLMNALVSRTNATYVSVLNIECPGGNCRIFAPDGAPMQFDYGHLTLSGSRWVVEQMPDFTGVDH